MSAAIEARLAENSPSHNSADRALSSAAKPARPPSPAPARATTPLPRRAGTPSSSDKAAASAGKPQSPTQRSAARPPTPTHRPLASRPPSPTVAAAAPGSFSANKSARPPTPTQRHVNNVVLRLTMTKEEQAAQKAKLEAERLKQELKGCTFSPNVNGSRKGLISTGSSATKKVPQTVFETLAKTPVRDHALYDDKKKDSDLKDCTFMPNTSRSEGRAASDVHERLFSDAKARKARLSGESNSSGESLREGETPALAKLRRQEEKKNSARKGA